MVKGKTGYTERQETVIEMGKEIAPNYDTCQTSFPGIISGKKSDYENQPQSAFVTEQECSSAAQVGGRCTKPLIPIDGVYISPTMLSSQKVVT